MIGEGDTVRRCAGTSDPVGARRRGGVSLVTSESAISHTGASGSATASRPNRLPTDAQDTPPKEDMGQLYLFVT